MSIWEKCRGFTFLELILACAILSLLLSMALPAFSYVQRSSQFLRLTTELNALLLLAKSEAVLRNQILWLHFSFAENQIASNGNWLLSLTDDAQSGSGRELAHLSGYDFHLLTLKHNYARATIRFEPLRGRPTRGSIWLYQPGRENRALKIVLSNPPGRVRICSMSADPLYGYASC